MADRIVAVVNDEAITQSDVTASVNALLPSDASPHQLSEADAVKARHAMLERLIERRLMLQQAKAAGVAVSAQEVAQRLQAVKAQFDSEEAFQRMLADEQLTDAALKEQLRESLMIKRVVDEKVRATIFISPQEVAQALAAHPELERAGHHIRVSHLLIRVREGRTEAQAKAMIGDIVKQLGAGAAFEAIAKRVSEDPYAPQGGSMGWVSPNELLPELGEALTRLTVGQTSPPIRTQLGYHLVRLDEERQVTDAKAQANRAAFQYVYQQKFESAFRRWLDQLKQRAYIEILAQPE